MYSSVYRHDIISRQLLCGLLKLASDKHRTCDQSCTYLYIQFINYFVV